MHFSDTENPSHIRMILAFYICSVFLLWETYYFDQWFVDTFTRPSMACARATGQRDKGALAALRGYNTSHLKYNVPPLLWQVHLKPISSSTDDDGDDIEQITKAL